MRRAACSEINCLQSNEPNWKSNLLEDISIEIDDMSQGKMIVSILPDVERSDTKSDLLAENHCIVTGQKGEIEGNHSERTGPHHTAILSKDNRMNSKTWLKKSVLLTLPREK